MLASIDCSFEQPFRCHYELVGTDGSIEVPDAYLPPANAKPTARLRTLKARSDSSGGRSEGQVLEFEPVNQYAAMVDSFAQAISARELVDPAENGRAQMIALDQVLMAASE